MVERGVFGHFTQFAMPAGRAFACDTRRIETNLYWLKAFSSAARRAVIEIQRVLVPGERFETERLRFPQEMPVPDQMVAQLSREVATLIAITESRAIKRDLEQGDRLYLRLNLVAQLQTDDSALPVVYDLVREMVG